MKTVENKNVGTPYVINGQPVPALEYAAHCKSIIEGLKPERERYYIAMQVPGISDEDHDDLVAEYFEADATIKECIADIAKITGEEIVDEAPMGKWWNAKPEVDKAHISDSLTRAMKTALEKFQQFCLVKNLTAAENELKLYNICRLATRELWR